jgi:hypothetical protein
MICRDINQEESMFESPLLAADAASDSIFHSTEK